MKLGKNFRKIFCRTLVAIFGTLLFTLSMKVAQCATDEFHEEVFFKPLAGGKVYSYFQFTTLWNVTDEYDDDHFDHCRLFPRSLAEILRAFDVQELHVSLTEGHWRHRYWGYPFVEAAPGAELWVWFRANAADDDDRIHNERIDRLWKGLTSALSGLLCASFNFIDSVNSVKPKFSFRLMGAVANASSGGGGDVDGARVRYATLPREIVCTENLTPWKKMLPCDSNKGLASLLNARYIHNTNYHSLGVHYRHSCADSRCTGTRIELKQTVSLVYDLVLLGGRIDEWSIRKLFGAGLFSQCPLADTSNVYVDVSDEREVAVELNKRPDAEYVTSVGGKIVKYAVYEVARHVTAPTSAFNLVVKCRRKPPPLDPSENGSSPPPPLRPSSSSVTSSSALLHVNRYIREYGKESGGIITKIYNNHREPTLVVYFENVPWFVPIYYHTLKIRAEGGSGEIEPVAKHYTPGRVRSRPYHLEVVFWVPGRTVVDISVDFDYMFLKWQEYPPDANHGFYVGSAVVSAALPYARNYHALPPTASLIRDAFNATASRPRNSFVVQMRTESFILGLPTPDFSMPYNVICLSCTVVALAFGPLHNITTKRLRLSKHSNKSKLRTFLSTTLTKLLGGRTRNSENQSSSGDAAATVDACTDARPTAASAAQ